jgi:hypothetical protein
MTEEARIRGGLLALALLVSLAGPALGDEAAIGEGGGGYLPLGDGWGTSSDIDIIEPNEISSWSLTPGEDNIISQGITLKVKADAAWSVSVSDGDKTTNGKMTEYDTINEQYVDQNPKQLGAFMMVKANGDYVTLPEGGEIAGSTSDTGGVYVDVPITLKQTVSGSDPISADNREYRILITYTGSITI